MLLLCYTFCITKKQIFVVFLLCKLPSSALRGRRTVLSHVLRSQTPFLCACISACIFLELVFFQSLSLLALGKRVMQRDFLKKLEVVRVTSFVLMSRAYASISSAIQAQILQFRFWDSFLCRVVVLLLLLLLFRRRFLLFFLLWFLLWFLLLRLRCIQRRWRWHYVSPIVRVQ